MATIEFIYFDLGNVILPFDHDLMCRQMASVAGVDASTVKHLLFETDLQTQYETGLISSRQYFETFCKETNSTPDQAAFFEAAGNMFELNYRIIPLITQLQAVNFPIGILSNTCEAHWDFVGRHFITISQYFPLKILSYVVHSMKPDEGIFQAAIEAAGCPAEKIFFVDDKAGNVEAAKAAGLVAVQFEDAASLIKTLQQFDLRFNL